MALNGGEQLYGRGFAMIAVGTDGAEYGAGAVTFDILIFFIVESDKKLYARIFPDRTVVGLRGCADSFFGYAVVENE